MADFNFAFDYVASQTGTSVTSIFDRSKTLSFGVLEKRSDPKRWIEEQIWKRREYPVLEDPVMAAKILDSHLLLGSEVVALAKLEPKPPNLFRVGEKLCTPSEFEDRILELAEAEFGALPKSVTTRLQNFPVNNVPRA